MRNQSPEQITVAPPNELQKVSFWVFVQHFNLPPSVMYIRAERPNLTGYRFTFVLLPILITHNHFASSLDLQKTIFDSKFNLHINWFCINYIPWGHPNNVKIRAYSWTTGTAVAFWLLQSFNLGLVLQNCNWEIQFASDDGFVSLHSHSVSCCLRALSSRGASLYSKGESDKKKRVSIYRI